MAVKRRLILKRFRQKREPQGDGQLTALIDIIVFMLVFLIQTVSISKLNMALQGDIHLPESKSYDESNRGISIQVTKNLDVFIENQKVALDGGSPWTPANSKIILGKLQEVKMKLEDIIKNSNTLERFNLIVNLAMDKDLDYSVIKNLMDLSTSVGITQFKFIVMGR